MTDGLKAAPAERQALAEAARRPPRSCPSNSSLRACRETWRRSSRSSSATPRSSGRRRVEQAAATKSDEPIVACDAKEKIKYVLGPVGVDGKNVTDAKAQFDQQRGQWIVTMSFDGKGSSDFGKITGKLAKKQQPQNQFAIALDGEVVSAPSVSQRLTPTPRSPAASPRSPPRSWATSSPTAPCR